MTNSPSLIDKSRKRFQNLVLITVVIIYLVVLAGGIVRGTGSGMGCPDWPRCFGRWIPPTEVQQLPANYQQIYGAKLKGEVIFNATKTWIEYINRLLGVLSGLFVFATLLASLSYWHKDKAIVYGGLATFLLIGANGWLGSRVVATELAHYLVTIHLMLAILVVFALLFVLIRSYAEQPVIESYQSFIDPKWVIAILLVITIGQITLGTQVRDALNDVIRRVGYNQRENWISELDWRFYFHRSFSIFVLGAHLLFFFQLRKLNEGGTIKKLVYALIVLVILEIIAGVVMADFSVPAFAQPIHLLLAVLIIGVQFSLGLLLNPKLLLPGTSVQRTRLAEV